jgi:hypothetical protein
MRGDVGSKATTDAIDEAKREFAVQLTALAIPDGPYRVQRLRGPL